MFSQAYEAEVRARHKGGMAKDMADLMMDFGGDSGSAPSASTSIFASAPTGSLFSFGAKKKAVKIAKAKPIKTIKKTGKITMSTKAKKPVKPTKATKKSPKTAAVKKMTKKSTPKTSVKKIKGKTIKRIPKKKAVIKKVGTRPNFLFQYLHFTNIIRTVRLLNPYLYIYSCVK